MLNVYMTVLVPYLYKINGMWNKWMNECEPTIWVWNSCNVGQNVGCNNRIIIIIIISVICVDQKIEFLAEGDFCYLSCTKINILQYLKRERLTGLSLVRISFIKCFRSIVHWKLKTSCNVYMKIKICLKNKRHWN